MKFLKFLKYIPLPIFTLIIHTFSLKSDNIIKSNNLGFNQFNLNSILGNNHPDVEFAIEPITTSSIKNEFSQTVDGFSKIKKNTQKYKIGDSNHRYYLVAIESINKKSRFPFYGTFITLISCENINRMITYEQTNKQFVNIILNCIGNANVKFDHGKLTIIIEKNKYNSIEATSYKIKDFPALPKFLINFRDDLFALNFKHEVDQSFHISIYIPQYIGYISLDSQYYYEVTFDQKYVHIPYSDKYRYIIFESTDYNYAVPIHNECHAKVNVKEGIIENTCGNLEYLYDIRNGLLFYKGVELLTRNIGGLRVIITNNMKNLIILSKETLYYVEQLSKNYEKKQQEKKISQVNQQEQLIIKETSEKKIFRKGFDPFNQN
ncbi:hypothetical protein ChUKH1_11650 [Cryptosporidium hominis]|uniref:Transmembrane protein n=2 Tax=Cryptosporidium hominis TaxID=237895 RepID=A0ABX5B927_CRYHO|nr:hypothetical protein ChTU502y2012_318g0010 [Cryptosporidium hominis]PPA62937.1 hypothetical protein ChUKH1_11650 [Cryptosporidium hominis]PPS92340.1 Uncharacterized protein GY17_00003976 [Cryptosporidium hominis]|eukprot:PPS92340.1 Uncharacterized protein GY17_00003976 [Cryptosporidium hominis]